MSCAHAAKLRLGGTERWHCQKCGAEVPDGGAPLPVAAETTPAEVGGQSSLLERHNAAEVLRLQAYSRDLEARLQNVEKLYADAHNDKVTLLASASALRHAEVDEARAAANRESERAIAAESEVAKLRAEITSGLQVAYALTLETQTVESATVDLVRQVREARQQRDEARAEVEKLRDVLASKHGGEPEALLRELDKARAEVERLTAVLSSAVVAFGPVTRNGKFSEGGEQRGNRIDCEEALDRMTAAIRARGGGK